MRCTNSLKPDDPGLHGLRFKTCPKYLGQKEVTKELIEKLYRECILPRVSFSFYFLIVIFFSQNRDHFTLANVSREKDYFFTIFLSNVIAENSNNSTSLFKIN